MRFSTRINGALIAVLVLAVLVWSLSAILLPFVVGAIVAYVLDPIADRLEECGLSRLLATSILTATFFSLLVLAGLFLMPILTGQLVALAGSIPANIEVLKVQYLPKVEAWMLHLDPSMRIKLEEYLTGFSSEAVAFLGEVLAGVWSNGVAAIHFLSLLFVTPVVAFYMLKEWDVMVAGIDSLIPRAYAPVARKQFREIDSTLSGYFHGQTQVCLLLGSYYAAGLMLLGVDSALLIGVTTGVLSFIPYVGALFGLVAGVMVAFLQSQDISLVGMVIAVFAIGQILEGNVVSPYLVGNKIRLHPVWIIFALLAGGAWLGFLGILLAVPVAGCLGVMIRFAVAEYQKTALYRESKKR